MKKEKKRSPLREKPLRNPGQSLQEEIWNLWDSLISPITYSAGFVGLAIYEWYRKFVDVPPNPYLVTVVAIIAIGLTIIRFTKVNKKLKQLKMGRDGEIEVGHLIDRLQIEGARVFHDVPGNDFNVDHVVISNKGIFVIETKTYSKPIKGDVRVDYDGEKLLVNGYEPDRNPVEQVKSLSRWLRQLLEESTGKKFSIKPVVVFPGWFVEPMKGKQQVWVLNNKALLSFIANESKKIPDEDVNLAAYHLSRYIRNH